MTCPCEPTCCYSAKKLYLKPSQLSNQWPSSVVLSAEINNVLSAADGTNNTWNNDIEELFGEQTIKNETERRALLMRCLAHPRTHYGRCVYAMDNDVCDNQVVCMEFDDGSTASMTMVATSVDTCERKTCVYGTRGELRWNDADPACVVEHYDFLSGQKHLLGYDDALPSIAKSSPAQTNPHIKLTGHGGSDYFLIDSFIEAVIRNDPSFVCTDVEDSFRSHLIVFAAEFARRNRSVVDIDEFCRANDIKLDQN